MLKKYNNLSLFSKISFVMCGLALVLSTVITLTAVIYYRYIFRSGCSAASGQPRSAPQTRSI